MDGTNAPPITDERLAEAHVAEVIAETSAAIVEIERAQEWLLLFVERGLSRLAVSGRQASLRAGLPEATTRIIRAGHFPVFAKVAALARLFEEPIPYGEERWQALWRLKQWGRLRPRQAASHQSPPAVAERRAPRDGLVTFAIAWDIPRLRELVYLEIRNLLEAELARKGWFKGELSEAMGCGSATVSHLLDSTFKPLPIPSLMTLGRLAAHFRLEEKHYERLRLAILLVKFSERKMAPLRWPLRHGELCPYRRWVFEGAERLNMSLVELASRAGMGDHVFDPHSGGPCPNKRSIVQLERLLGPMPPEARKELQEERRRRRTKGVKRFRRKVSLWTKEQLVDAIGAILPDIPKELQHKLNQMPWGKRVGVQGFDIYKQAQLVVARMSRSPEGLARFGQGSRKGVRKPRGDLRIILNLLEKGRIVFECCVSCGQLKRRAVSLEPTALCRPCQMEYQRTPAFRQWVSEAHQARRNGQEPPPRPAIPRRRGVKPNPHILARNAAFLIRHTLGETIPEIADRFRIDDAEIAQKGAHSLRQLLEKSSDAGCRRLLERIQAVEESRY